MIKILGLILFMIGLIFLFGLLHAAGIFLILVGLVLLFGKE